MKGTKKSCLCEACKAACRYKPGWFAPGEAEKVADYFGISLQELFKTKLMVDWWEEDDEGPDTFVLSPAIIGKKAGTEFPANPEGTCVFFKEGLCEIHSVHPLECRKMIHDERNNGLHEQIAKAWISYQGYITKLLGRTPKSVPF